MEAPPPPVLPSAAAARLLEEIPDAPVWVEVRDLLLSGDCTLFQGAEGTVVAGTRTPLLGLVGRPSVEAIREAARESPPRAELLAPSVHHEELVERALPGWEREVALIHALSPGEAEAVPVSSARVALLSRNRPPAFGHLPFALRDEVCEALENRSHVAAGFDGETPVSFCYTASETETLWDVSIDTARPFRRRGLARECAAFLIHHMTVHGKAPVWGAFDSDEASRRLAVALGFRPAGRVLVFRPPGRPPRS